MGGIMVSAGEVSGDMHAAKVVNKMKELVPGLKFFGMGSTQLSRAGVEILLDPTEISSIGFVEALQNIRIHLKHLKQMKELIAERRPDIVFLVDYSAFNMKLAKACAKMGIPVVDYFPPTAWIWGKWRARKLARYGTTIAAVFPMERDVYQAAGADVSFVGHPLLDFVRANESERVIREEIELGRKKQIVGLLPGSRKSEIEKMLPIMLSTAELLQQENPGLQFVLPLAQGVDKEKIRQLCLERSLVVKLVEDYTYQVMKVADLLLTTSGTATVEAAILETPMVICYQTGASSYWLGKKLMQVDFVGMPNIISGREIVPELIQDDLTVDRLYLEANRLLKQPYLLKDIELELAQLKKKLGGIGAVTRTARLVLEKGGLLS